MKNIYINGEYLAKHPTWSEEDSSWKAQKILKMLKNNNLRPKSICEIGCGTGEILNQLYGELPDYVSFFGYEISPHAYELSQKKNKERLQFYLRDFLIETTCYDVLLVIDVIEHIEDYYTFLRSIRKRAEFKIFHIPLDMSVQKIILNVPMRRRESFGHIQYFMKETAVATLLDTGYEIVDLFYTSISLDTSARSFTEFLGNWGLQLGKAVLDTMFNEDLAVRLLGGHSLMILAK